MAKGYWLNTKYIRISDIKKPCIKLGYCPYGQLVEEYPLGDKRTKLSCTIDNGAIIPFGHDCPVHYLAEGYEPVKKQPIAKAVKIVEKKQPKKIEQPKKKSTNNWPFN